MLTSETISKETDVVAGISVAGRRLDIALVDIAEYYDSWSAKTTLLSKASQNTVLFNKVRSIKILFLKNIIARVLGAAMYFRAFMEN